MRTYSIVGMNFINSEKVVAALPAGTPVVLIREPNNVHDRNAIAVWGAGQRLGYIPKKQNFVLAQFIDQNGAEATKMAMDAADLLWTADTPGSKYIRARFVRSPHSGYPLVEV